MNHTKGKWAVQDRWPNYVVRESDKHKARGGSVFEKEDQERYATIIAICENQPYRDPVWGHEISPQEAEANARLIASAPRMYDWLKRMSPSWDKEAKSIIAEIEGREGKV